MMHIINRNYRYFTVHQLGHIRVVKIGTYNYDSLKIPVPAMFIIGHLPVFKAGVDKCNIIS